MGRLAGLRLGAWLLACAMLCGCDRSPPTGERGERFFRRGQAYLKEGKSDAALRCFLSATHCQSKTAAEAHLECGEIYLSGKNDPLSAIYHYREYLRRAPRNRQTALVRQRVGTAEKAYLGQIPLLKQLSRESHGDLLRTLKAMQDENAKLKRQVTLLLQKFSEMRQLGPAAASAAAGPKTEGSPPPAASGGGRSSYAVQSGDTLSSISQKIYGSPGRWREIFDANRDRISSPAQLKVGVSLAIP
jgi:tetratricopeptide (TPR) repeat protein